MDYLALHPMFADSMAVFKSAFWLLLLLGFIALVWWGASKIEFLAPFIKIIHGVLIVVAIIVVVLFVFHVVGKPPF